MATSAARLHYSSERAVPVTRGHLRKQSLRAPWSVFLIGITVLGRTFAGIGVSPVFVGEMFFAGSVARNRNNWLGRLIDDSLRLQPLALAIVAHLLWGIFEILRCLLMDRSIVDILKTAAFNYFPLYCLIGISIGRDLTRETFLKFWKTLLTVYCIWAASSPFLKAGFLDIGGPMISSLVPVGTLALWNSLKNFKYRMPLLIISMYPLFFSGTHGRGTLLGFIIGGAVIAAASWQRLIRCAIIVAATIAVLMIVGPLIPGPEGTAPPLDPMVEAARLIASYDQDLAIKMVKSRNYKNEVDNLISAKGTAYWRKVMWTNAMRTLSTTGLKLMGQGEGSSMAGLTSDASPDDLRSPHNIVIYCIYYTGYVGLFTFVAFLVALFVTAQQMVDPELRIFVLATIWGVVLVAVTGNCLEAPHGAIPFYLLCGVTFGVDRRIRDQWIARRAPLIAQDFAARPRLRRAVPMPA